MIVNRNRRRPLHIRRFCERFGVPIAIALLVILTYWPGLTGAFILDDYANIVTNARVHMESVSVDSLGRAALGYATGVMGRPLSTLSFAFNWYLGGLNPWGYKLVGILIHVANAVLVLALLRKIMAATSSIDCTRVGPGFCIVVALAWALHPLQVSSVLYVVQRMETLSLTFVLMALIAYIHGRTQQAAGTTTGWYWLILSVLLAGLGMLSKETAVLFPAYTLALELTILRFNAASERNRRYLVTGYALVGAAAILIFIYWAIPKALSTGAFSNRDFTPYERLLSQCRILPMYLWQMVFPSSNNMPFYYDAYQKSTGWLTPLTTSLGALFLVALAAIGIFLRHRTPLISLGILWFFASHILTSNIYNLELAFEHRNYFALLGTTLAVAAAIAAAPLSTTRYFKSTLAITLIGALTALCALRSATWGNDLILARTLVDISPDSPRAGNHLGTRLITSAGRNPASSLFHEGMQEMERTSLLPGAPPSSEAILILAATDHGQPVDMAWWQRLVGKIRTQPVTSQTRASIVNLLQSRENGTPINDSSLEQAYTALFARGNQPAYLYAMAGDHALLHLHDDELATAMFIRVVELGRSDPDFVLRVIDSLRLDGYTAVSEATLKRAHELGIRHPTPSD